MSEYFPSLWEETDIQAQETQRIPKKRNPETSIPTNIIIKVSKKRGSSKQWEKNSLLCTREPHTCRFFSRNLVGHMGMACHIQSTDRIKLPTKNVLPSKVILQNKRREFSSKQKAKGVQLLPNWPYKKCCLSWKEMALIHDSRTHESKNLTVKNKHVIKVIYLSQGYYESQKS